MKSVLISLVFLSIAIGTLLACGTRDPQPELFAECERFANSLPVLEETIMRGCEQQRDHRILRTKDPEAAAEKECRNRLVLLGANVTMAEIRCQGGGSPEALDYIQCRESAYNDGTDSDRCILR